MGRRAFTLTEMLVCIAVIAALAAILFPVFRGAREAARETQCFSNHRQIALAANLYAQDYDDRFVPVNYAGGAPNPTYRNDRTWVQMLLPYVRTFAIFRCPADHTHGTESEASFDPDLVPGDTYARFYTASRRVNSGYNYLYLSPIEWAGNEWRVNPRVLTGIEDPSRMIFTVDSVFDRDASGRPMGGGRDRVIPPCRFREVGNTRFDTFPVNSSGAIVFAESEGWVVNDDNHALRYGGAYGWHEGRVTVSYVDGSVRSVPPQVLSRGCQLNGGGWSGSIGDPDSYLWDSE